MLSKKNKIYYFSFGFLTAAVIIYTAGAFSFKLNSNDNRNDFPQGYRIISPQIPDDLSFCNERVPIENLEVKERIDRELVVNTYFHSSTILSMKRANRWFPVIEPILQAYNIPDDFKYLAVIESGLTNAVSPAGATGFWQFLEEPAEKYGLEVDDEVDERYNVEKSTVAACKYLQDAYNQFGSWTMAGAAFNMGFDGIQKQIERQKAKNYYNLVLGDETSRYIARIIAVKEIFLHPKEYGYDLKPEDLYPPLKYYTIEISGSVDNFADYAANYGINYKILKYFNPWLRDDHLTNKNHYTYVLKIPEKGFIKIIKE